MVLVQEDDSSQEHVVYYLSKGLTSPKFRYSQLEKLALVAFHVVQILRHYILPIKKTILDEINPMKHILSHPIIRDKYSKWIVILQGFDIKFINTKAKKSLTFAELVSELPDNKEETVEEEPWGDEHLFLIATTDLWYGTLIIYLQTQRIYPQFSRIE